MQVGLIGYPVAHSLSPAMQQAAFDAPGIAARYNLWETPPGALAERIASLRAPGMLGANVTIPYKEHVVSLVDECDPLSARIGAVNTIVNRAGRLIGYNTDAPGFLRALDEGMASMASGGRYEDRQHSGLYAKRVVLLGTGGAARAAAVALLESGIQALLLLGRTPDKVVALLNHLRALAATMDNPPDIMGALLEGAGKEQGQQPVLYNGILSGGDETMRFLSSADVLVNATSVGLKTDEAGKTDTARLLIDVNTLPATSLVMDMIFNPPQTALLRAARKHGCATLNGLSMLLYQGALAFELWTGCPAPLEVMRNALGL
jgi:shikimate dehydrogenase